MVAICRYAVVTGANKGIGIETVRQLATVPGMTVVLTARNERRGLEAAASLRDFHGLSNVIFHQLNVQDPNSIASWAEFIANQFGRLDILVRRKKMFLAYKTIAIRLPKKNTQLIGR